MADTSIEWTKSDDGTPGKVWNPVRGCSLVSAGCSRCYAMRLAYRFSGPGQPYEGLVKMGASGPIWTGVLREVPEKLDEPLSWRKPCRVFVNSMSDLFHEDVSDEFIAAVFAVMAMTPKHTYQILTKRPERAAAWFASISDDPADAVSRGLASLYWEDDAVCAVANYINGWSRWRDLPDDGNPLNGTVKRWPLPNVHAGVSVENQATADERLPWLAKIPTVVPWVSYEPALGPVDFTPWLGWLKWMVQGGESGPGARPLHPLWAKTTRDQCVVAGVPYHFKQWGAYEPMAEGEAWSSYMITESENIPQDSKNVVILHPDGRAEYPKPTREWWTLCDAMLAPDPEADDPEFFEGPVAMHRVGKKIAGRELDGREWNEFPTPIGA